MLASCQERVTYHCGVFSGFSLEECKEAVVSNIRPLSLRVIITDYASRYMNPAFTFEALVSLIVQEFEDELFVVTRSNSRGVDNFTNLVTNEADKPKLRITCFNCGVQGHAAQVCTAVCKFHGK